MRDYISSVPDPENKNYSWLESIDWVNFEKLAALGYKPKDIAAYYQIPVYEFLEEFTLPDSKTRSHYMHGRLIYTATEGTYLLDQGITGNNPTQATRLDRLREKVDWQNTLDELVYD